MSFWSRLAIIVDFFKDLFFDNKEESDFKHSSFNTRKFTIFLLFVCLISLSSFLSNRTLFLYKKVKEQEVIIITQEKQLKTCTPPAVPQTPTGISQNELHPPSKPIQ